MRDATTQRNYTKLILTSFFISAVGVFVIDYFSHLLFSSPMETMPYFLAKMATYFVFSLIFLMVFDLEKYEFIKVVAGGVAVSLIWGAYYNVLPLLFDYYPLGISLSGISFLGMGILGTGLAFGIVHTLAFIGGYYAAKYITKKI